MSKSVKFAAFLGLAALTTWAVCDQSAEAGRRHRNRQQCCSNGWGYWSGNGSCYNGNCYPGNCYGGNYDNGCGSGCGNFASPCGQVPCGSGACGVQQPACSPCGSTTMNPAPQTGYEHSSARPTYREPNQLDSNTADPDQFDRDQYIQDQRLNNPDARNMTDEQILRQRDRQLQSDESVRSQQENPQLNQIQPQTDRNLQDTNREIQQNLNNIEQRVPDSAVPPVQAPPAVK